MLLLIKKRGMYPLHFLWGQISLCLFVLLLLQWRLFHLTLIHLRPLFSTQSEWGSTKFPWPSYLSTGHLHRRLNFDYYQWLTRDSASSYELQDCWKMGPWRLYIHSHIPSMRRAGRKKSWYSNQLTNSSRLMSLCRSGDDRLLGITQQPWVDDYLSLCKSSYHWRLLFSWQFRKTHLGCAYSWRIVP